MMAELLYNEKKRKLTEDVQRTGGVFGTVELALLEEGWCKRMCI